MLLRRTLAAPPLWVLAGALTANLAEVPIPRSFLHVVLVIGQTLMLLVPLAMGLLVSARGMRRPTTYLFIAIVWMTLTVGNPLSTSTLTMATRVRRARERRRLRRFPELQPLQPVVSRRIAADEQVAMPVVTVRRHLHRVQRKQAGRAD